MNQDFDLLAPMAVLPAWTYINTLGPLSGPLVPAGDKLIGIAGPNVFAIDIHTGKAAETAAGQPWFVELVGLKGRDPNVTTSQGVVYLMDDDSLRAVGLGDAQPLASWPKKNPQVPRCNLLLVQDGRLVAVSTDNRGATLIRGFDPLTGELKFGPYKRDDKSAGRLAYGAKAVFFVASGEFIALNTDFGDKRWGFKPKGDVLDGSSAPLVTDKVAFVSGASLYGVDTVGGEQLYQIDTTNGSSGHWYTPVAEIPKAATAATQAANLQVVRPLLGDAAGTSRMLRANLGRVAGGIAVAVNDGGDVVGFTIADGNELWRKRVVLPGPPVLVDGVVHLTTDDGKYMRQLDARTGKAVSAPFDLDGQTKRRPAVIANGSLFNVDDASNIVARTFAIQHAAYFDGKQSHIKIQASQAQYDFGVGDFTVEAWFRSSTGGEIISSYPTNDDPQAHGFRLRLDEGQVRVAVLNRDGSSRHVGRTSDTGADDGQWHHVAFVRRSGQFLIVLDGVSQVVNLADGQGEDLTIGGNSALTIGAFIFPNIPARGFFRGLLREVRVWDHAVDVVNIATNREMELTGREPRLKGLWRLDDDQTGQAKTAPQNEAHRGRDGAEFVAPDSRPTDLTMDKSAFPYLLHEPREQWPYAGTWGARGEHVAVGTAAISSDGVVAFATNNAIYAVDAHDGHRFWSMDVDRNTSCPVADGASFLVMTNDDALVRVNARNGGKEQVEAFSNLPNGGDAVCPEPAVTQECIAAASAGGSPTVAIWDRASPQAVSRQLTGTVLRLELGGAGLAVLTQAANGSRTLSLLARDTAALLGQRAVTTDAFCVAGPWLFATSGNKVIKLAGGDLGSPALATSAALDGDITGLVASTDQDLLAVTTTSGTVYRMMLGNLAAVWNTSLPAGPVSGNKALNPPVLDAGGRILCTSASGTVAALDDDTGRLMGLYAMDHSPQARPATAAGGTLYTACADAIVDDAEDNIDGALHALLMGDTVAMRLNVDPVGKGLATAQHAVVDAPTSDATLHLLEVSESCVEAWINAPQLAPDGGVPSGGGIVSILPSEESKFDIQLWLDADGTLHYSSHALDEGTWSGLHYTAATTLLDGNWHHIAASRTSAAETDKAADRVLIYIDGELVPATRQDAPGAPSHLTPGLKAYIGAACATDLSATLPFHGMIAEVRVWDTYLVANEITSRMHVKLRGDEPDLLAYWNFDHGLVHDSAVQGHDGALALPVTAPVWWLTDLPFTQPAYPHISSSAGITATEGGTTTYSLTLKVCAADGSGMAGQEVHLWYVKRKPDDPASILIDTEELQGVSTADEPHPLLMASQLAKAWSGRTESDGTLRVTVIASGAAGRGPSIDMWTAFMPLNERLHVNVLLDDQKLTKPAPPKLTAQAKLMQDYHYTTGSKVDHTRDRSTWRTVIRAASAADQPRGYEPVTLWASEPVTFESNSHSYSVNKDNAVTLTTEASGELTLVMNAGALAAPTLYARAGFMHRDDRIVINPDQEAHSQLANISDNDLTQQRVTNWKRPQDAKPTDADSMLPANARSEAPKVATAVRQVASAVKPADPNAPPKSLKLTPARAKLLQMRPMPEAERGLMLRAGQANAWQQPRLAAMRQAEPTPRSDEVVPRRTLAGMACLPPVDPEAFRGAMDGALGFSFEKTGPNRVTYTSLMTQEEVDLARGQATPDVLQAHMLGGLFDDIWGGIKDAANKVAETVTKVVVTIADTVQLAITKMVDGIQQIVHTVVSSVKDALNAIGTFFEQIGAEIAKVIAFLRALFDWGNIIKTHNILRDIFNTSLSISSERLKNTAPFVNSVRSLAGFPIKPIAAGGQSMNAAINATPDQQPGIAASANSVQGKSLTQKTTTTPARSVGAVDQATPDPQASPDDISDVLLQALPKLASSVLDLSPESLLRQLQDIAKAAAGQMLVTAAQSLAQVMGTLATATEWALKVLNTSINIPFISELYKWITGSDLTIMSVLCLALAIPVNIAYAVFTLAQGGARYFFDDGRNIAANMRAAANGKPLMLQAPALVAGDTVPRTPSTPEFAFMVMRSITILADAHADTSFTETRGQGQMPDEFFQGYTGILNIFQGVAGMISLSLQTFCTHPAYARRVEAVAKDKATDFLPRYSAQIYVVYGLLMAVRAKTLYAGLMYLYNGPNPAPGFFARLKERWEYPVTKYAGLAAIGVLIYQITMVSLYYPKLKDCGNPDVAEEYRYLAIRDILGVVTVLAEFMYTEKGAKMIFGKLGETSVMLYRAVTMTRFAANTAGIVMHGEAVYRYGDIDGIT